MQINAVQTCLVMQLDSAHSAPMQQAQCMGAQVLSYHHDSEGAV